MYLFENMNADLVSTNYFESEVAKSGEFYLTWNGGCGRFLVPGNQKSLIREMRCDHVVVTQMPDRVVILFDDKSDFPFSVQMALEQTDCIMKDGEYFFSVYIKEGEKFRFPCVVENLT